MNVGLMNKIVKEICEEEEIGYKDISYGWINELSKNGKVHYVRGDNFDLNSFVAKTIADDKYATYEVLKDRGVNILEHNMIFNPKTREMNYKESFIENAKKMIDTYGKVVIKANCSFSGKDVFLCETKEEVDRTILQLFSQNNDTLSCQPFYDITYEYRCVFLNGEIIYIYKKEKPYKIVNGEKIYTSWKHNLSQGGIPILIDEKEKHYSEIIDLATRAGNAVNIKFASIDIALTSSDELYVVEINNTVCLTKFSSMVPDGYNIAKRIYKKAIDCMFED